MEFFSYLKSLLPGSAKRRDTGMTMGPTPLYSAYGQNIYMSDFVNNAIDRIATEISKIEIKSIVERGETVAVQNDDLTRLFRFRPNPLQTTSDFLGCVEWLRRKRMHAIIYPVYDLLRTADGQEVKRYTAMYVLNPTSIRMGVLEDGATWEIELTFGDGSVYTLPYSSVIHLKWRRGCNTILGGGDDNGLPNTYDAARTLDALDKTIQGLPQSIEASLSLNAIYSAKTMADSKRLENETANFESRLKKSSLGIVATDLVGEFTPLNLEVADIPPDILVFLKSYLRERYGVSAAILSGDYNGDQHSAFYQTAIEDFLIQFEQAASSVLFTQREQDVGHRLRCYYSKVAYLSTNDKLALATLATNTGLMMLNQIGGMFGMAPFVGGNRRLQSLNYHNAETVDAYQAATSGAKIQELEEENPDEPK